MKYLKKFENFYLITEDPDSVYLQDGTILSANKSNGRPFVFDDNSDMVFIGDVNKYHHQSKNTDYTEDGPKSFPGRFWLDKKIISFWVYPKEEDFPWYINRLEKSIGEKIFNNGWQIEIRLRVDGKKIMWEEDHSTNYSFNSSNKEVLIPIEEYVGSENATEEQKMLHLMKSKEKRKALLSMGSKPKEYITTKGMTQAQSRNMKTKFRFTESYKINEK